MLDAAWGVIAVLSLAVIVFGYLIVDLTKRIESLETNQRSLLNASMQTSNDLMELGKIVSDIVRKH